MIYRVQIRPTQVCGIPVPLHVAGAEGLALCSKLKNATLEVLQKFKWGQVLADSRVLDVCVTLKSRGCRLGFVVVSVLLQRNRENQGDELTMCSATIIKNYRESKHAKCCLKYVFSLYLNYISAVVLNMSNNAKMYTSSMIGVYILFKLLIRAEILNWNKI